MGYTSPMSTHDELHHYLDANLPNYLYLLRQMVDINSFTANPKGVDRLGELTAEKFVPLGFEVERVPAQNFLYGRHVFLSRRGEGENGRPAPVIGLISHLDTVYPKAEEDANEFHWRIDGDRVYGPGTVDIKGGTVMIYMILDGLRRYFPDVFNGITWHIMLNAAEEVLAPDFGELVRGRMAGGLAALVFEGGEVEHRHYRLVTARKGMAQYRIEVEGRGSHAGASHEMGANAIVQMADVIREVAGFTDYGRALTFNVGTIMGGTVMNRVPHQAAASVEMRAFDTAVFDEGVERMLALNKMSTVRSPGDGYPCRVAVRLEGRWQPWPDNAATNRLFGVWVAAAAALGHPPIHTQARGGLSDGNWLWDLLPTIDGLGPEGYNSHSSERSADGSKDQEYVLASSFVPKALLNINAIVRLHDAALN